MPCSAARASVARWWFAFALLFVLGASLRLYHLGYRSLSTDEANVFWMARGSVDEIVLQNAIGNSAPPLYALALTHWPRPTPLRRRCARSPARPPSPDWPRCRRWHMRTAAPPVRCPHCSSPP